MDGYRSSDWSRFRAEVLRLDGYTCTRCGKGEASGVKLHVHHKQYLPGHKPWDYPHDMCEVLCAGCHAAEHGIIPPRFGWSLEGYDDLGDMIGVCENCSTLHRHSFFITHPNWRPMEVGTDCCDNLTCTQAASDHIESLKRYQQRRKTFVSSRRWQPSYPNGEECRRHKNIHIAIARDGLAFRLRINFTLGKKTFDSALEAKAAVFDLIETGALNQWLARPLKQVRLRRWR